MKTQSDSDKYMRNKERIRAEIKSHIEDFLNRGGQINVFDAGSSARTQQTDGTWPNANDDLGMND